MTKLRDEFKNMQKLDEFEESPFVNTRSNRNIAIEDLKKKIESNSDQIG